MSVLPSEELIAAMGQYNEELADPGVMVNVKSNEEAIEWVKRWPALDGGGEVELELRQVFEADDFGEALTPELREKEERLRARLAKK